MLDELQDRYQSEGNLRCETDRDGRGAETGESLL